MQCRACQEIIRPSSFRHQDHAHIKIMLTSVALEKLRAARRLHGEPWRAARVGSPLEKRRRRRFFSVNGRKINYSPAAPAGARHSRNSSCDRSCDSSPARRDSMGSARAKFRAIPPEKLRQTWAALAPSQHNALCDVATLRKTPQMAAGYVRHGV